MTGRIARTSYRRGGRLIPRRTHGLRAGSVTLRPHEAMDWHSTGDREELLILLAGRVQVEVEARPGGSARRAGASARITRVALSVGQCAFIPSEIPHRVLNRSRTAAHYLYVTAPTS